MRFILIYCSILAVIKVVSGDTCSASSPCLTKACCSQWGNCGYGPDFCLSGCLSGCDAKPECGQYANNSNCPLKVCCSQLGFCGTTSDFCSNGCQNNCEEPYRPTCSSGRNLLNIGYYASWSDERECNTFHVSNIDPRNYTHLNYAFGSIANGVMVEPSSKEERKLKAFVALKEINPNLKVLISVGGWAFNDPGPTRYEFHNIISSEDSRQKFISSVGIYLQKYNLDGIDIDYEYSGAEDRGGSPEDTENYVRLVREMRLSLGSGYLITIAAPTSYWYLRHFKVGEMSEYLDWINVMTYDIHGVWDAGITSFGPYVKSHTDIREIQHALDLFLRDGVQSNKLVLGLGYYGRGYTLDNPSCNSSGCRYSGPSRPSPCTNSPGVLAWFEIAKIISDNELAPVLETNSMSKIASWDDQWVSFDDEETLAFKREYASVHCMKGVIIWSIDMGLDRTEGSYSLSRMGSVSFANTQLSFITSRNNATTFQVKSKRDGRDGFDIFSIVVKEHNRRAKRQGDNRWFYNLWNIINTELEQNTGNDQMTRIITPDNDNNPINRVFVRHLPNGAERVEVISAYYTPQYLNPNNRINFPNSGRTSTQYMKNFLNANPDDERGHLVPSSISGPAVWYNMVPQHRSVNRNHNTIWLRINWVELEGEIRQYLTRNLGNVRWNAQAVYSNVITGRPKLFIYEAIFEDNNRRRNYSRFGAIGNGPPIYNFIVNEKCAGF